MAEKAYLAVITLLHEVPPGSLDPSPPGIWGGGNQPFPTPPIVIPPDAIAPGVPTHPIYIPVYPAHPIVIPPGSIDPGPPLRPEHPIVLPPFVPAHPIVIPPDAVAPGVPAHPIYLPPPGCGGWLGSNLPPQATHPDAGVPHPQPVRDKR